MPLSLLREVHHSGQKLARDSKDYSCSRTSEPYSLRSYRASRYLGLSIDQLDFPRFLKGVCFHRRSCDAKNCIHNDFTFDFSFVNFLGDYVLIANEAGDSYVVQLSVHLDLRECSVESNGLLGLGEKKCCA